MAIVVFGVFAAVAAIIYGTFLLAYGVFYWFGVDIMTGRLEPLLVKIIITMEKDIGNEISAAVFTTLFSLLAGWVVLKILRNRIIALMQYIETNTESGTCGLLGFTFLFFGFVLQLIGTIFG